MGAKALGFCGTYLGEAEEGITFRGVGDDMKPFLPPC